MSARNGDRSRDGRLRKQRNRKREAMRLLKAQTIAGLLAAKAAAASAVAVAV